MRVQHNIKMHGQHNIKMHGQHNIKMQVQQNIKLRGQHNIKMRGQLNIKMHTIGNRPRDLPACSTMRQVSAPPGVRTMALGTVKPNAVVFEHKALPAKCFGYVFCLTFKISFRAIKFHPGIFSLRLCGPTLAMTSLLLRLVDHTRRRITVCRTPLDE